MSLCAFGNLKQFEHAHLGITYTQITATTEFVSWQWIIVWSNFRVANIFAGLSDSLSLFFLGYF